LDAMNKIAACACCPVASGQYRLKTRTGKREALSK
jgi:hypothetical protein